jgi:hypothetical protein
MAAKLGSDDVSFRLGAGEVAAVYLGSQEVWSAVPVAATLYFDGAVDDAWTTVGNWWLDAGHTQAAGRLPAEDESVVASAMITASGQTVVNFTLSGEFILLDGTLTVTGMATFSGTTATLSGATISGNATVNGFSFNGGTVTGDATFNDSSRNSGTVTGTATFTGSACNDGGTAGTFVPDPPPSC